MAICAGMAAGQPAAVLLYWDRSIQAEPSRRISAADLAVSDRPPQLPWEMTMSPAESYFIGDTPAAAAILLALGRELALSATASRADLETAAADLHAEAAEDGVALDLDDLLGVVRRAACVVAG